MIGSCRRTDRILSLGQGLLKAGTTVIADEDSGLVELYLSEGVPVIHLLNLKQICADYGLPYDPANLLSIGESAIYYRTYYPVWAIIAAFLVIAILMVLYRKPEIMKKIKHKR